MDSKLKLFFEVALSKSGQVIFTNIYIYFLDGEKIAFASRRVSVSPSQ
jgi:hypothetical protein